MLLLYPCYIVVCWCQCFGSVSALCWEVQSFVISSVLNFLPRLSIYPSKGVREREVLLFELYLGAFCISRRRYVFVPLGIWLIVNQFFNFEACFMSSTFHKEPASTLLFNIDTVLIDFLAMLTHRLLKFLCIGGATIRETISLTLDSNFLFCCYAVG